MKAPVGLNPTLSSRINMPFAPCDRPVTSRMSSGGHPPAVIKPKERTYTEEYIVAAQELADFCYLSVEELFPDLAVSNSYRLYKEFKELEEAKKRGYIEVNADSFLEYFKKEAFIPVYQYARIYGAKAGITDISDGEIGRYHGIRVIFTDYVAQDKALREMMARNARREKREAKRKATTYEQDKLNAYDTVTSSRPNRFQIKEKPVEETGFTNCSKPREIDTKLTGRPTYM